MRDEQASKRRSTGALLVAASRPAAVQSDGFLVNSSLKQPPYWVSPSGMQP
jgi:hypothetical protein